MTLSEMSKTLNSATIGKRKDGKKILFAIPSGSCGSVKMFSLFTANHEQLDFIEIPKDASTEDIKCLVNDFVD